MGVELCIVAGKTGTTWSPSRIAPPPADCRLLVHGLHFTFTPVLMSSLSVPGHDVVCSALCSAL